MSFRRPPVTVLSHRSDCGTVATNGVVENGSCFGVIAGAGDDGDFAATEHANSNATMSFGVWRELRSNVW